MKLSSKNLFFVTAVGSALVIVFLAAVYAYLASGVSRAEGNLELLVEKIHEKEAEQQNAKILKGTLEERTSDLARIQSFFVAKDQPLPVIEFLESIARKTQNVLAIDAHEA